MADFLPVILEMRKSLAEKCDRLTPQSSKSEQEDYLKSLQHYKKIFQSYSARHNEDLSIAIEKAMKNVNSMVDG
jgi:hypothetical protein